MCFHRLEGEISCLSVWSDLSTFTPFLYLYYHGVHVLSRGSCIITGFMYYHGVHVLSRGSCIITGFMYYHGVHVLSRGSCIITGFMYYHGVHVLSRGSCIITGFVTHALRTVHRYAFRTVASRSVCWTSVYITNVAVYRPNRYLWTIIITSNQPRYFR